LTIKFAKPSGTIIEKDITSIQYNLDPILDYRVLPVNSKKVGYLAFSSFVSITKKVNEQTVNTAMYSRFEDIFNYFQSQGIDELIVDLRYNGGGATVTAEYLADWIIPTSANGKLMYRYEINSFLKGLGWHRDPDGFAPIYVAKKGTINLPRVYFLVTKGTASASELLINSLKPYMSVYMIGTYAVDDNNKQVAENTYGKPVGFFEWKIVTDDIGLYATSFQMFNSKDEGNYFDGLTPNAHVWEFATGKFLDFGDPSEAMLSSALNHIKSGSFTSASSRMAIASSGKVLTSRPKVKAGIRENTWRNNMFKFQDKDIKIR